MPLYYMVQGFYQSESGRGEHPTETAINGAWQRIATGMSGVPAAGTWLSPLPRITRTGGSSLQAPGKTKVAGVWVFPDQSQASINSVLPVLLDNVNRRMSLLDEGDYGIVDQTVAWIFGTTQSEVLRPSNWHNATAFVFNTAANGSLSFWQGQHAATQTSTDFPGITTMPDENPTGPGTTGSTSGLLDFMVVLKAAGWLVGLGALAYTASAVSSYMSTRERREKRYTRINPRKR